MKKKYCIFVQILLLLWFFLDMTGFYIGDKCLVTRSYQEDGLFFCAYLLTMLLFIVTKRFGNGVMIGWTAMWFATQFICHEWYTIFGGGFMGSLEGKIEYFSGTIPLLRVEGRYIPDLYHTILHILILAVLTVTILYTVKTGKKDKTDVSK